MSDVFVPSLGESITEGLIARWLKQNGDSVQVDDPLLELETDKATMEIVAQAAGALSIVAPEGSTVAVGAIVGKIAEGQASPSASPSRVSPATPNPATRPPTANTQAKAAEEAGCRRTLSPSVRRLVHGTGLDASTIEGSGPRGRVTKQDIAHHLEARSTSTVSDTSPAANETTRRPMSMLRRRIAERLVAAQQTAALLTTFNEIDMSAVIGLRKKYRDLFKEVHGTDLGFMSLFGRACCLALNEIPAVNAEIDGTDIVYHHHVHLGIAVSTDRGLVVPVIRYADTMSLHELEEAIAEMATKARTGKILPDDLSGGTFTISNGGIFGSLFLDSDPQSTPIGHPRDAQV